MSNCKSLTFGIALAATVILGLQSHASAQQSPPTTSARAAIAQLFTTYEEAWDRSDGNALGASYAADGDLMIPTGQLFIGPSKISAFYGSVFPRGYAGTRGTGVVQHVRMISPDIALTDGTWSIGGVHDAGGKTHDESGIFTAVIVRTDSGWKLAALREQSSGKSVSPQ